MRSIKLKTVKGHPALTRELQRLGVSDHAMDSDVLKEVDTPPGYPYTPYEYTGGRVAFWKGSEGRYFAWPEIAHLRFEIHELKQD